MITKKIQQGFTLIEVMLAMAVFAIAGVALLGGSDNNFRNLSHLETKVIANWVASNQLVATSLVQTWPPKNNKKGKVELAGREWHWKQKVEKTEDKNMRSVVMEIRLTEDEINPITSLTTFLSKAQP